jgi:hypothetical protein
MPLPKGSGYETLHKRCTNVDIGLALQYRALDFLNRMAEFSRASASLHTRQIQLLIIPFQG